VKFTAEGWLIGDELWDADFARAIAPVEYQRILSRSLKRRARRQKDIAVKMHIHGKAKALEDSAAADADCEIKWGARKD
jgi:hypothetical protein